MNKHLCGKDVDLESFGTYQIVAKLGVCKAFLWVWHGHCCIEIRVTDYPHEILTQLGPIIFPLGKDEAFIMWPTREMQAVHEQGNVLEAWASLLPMIYKILKNGNNRYFSSAITGCKCTLSIFLQVPSSMLLNITTTKLKLWWIFFYSLSLLNYLRWIYI